MAAAAWPSNRCKCFPFPPAGRTFVFPIAAGKDFPLLRSAGHPQTQKIPECFRTPGRINHIIRGTTRIDKTALPSKCFFALSTHGNRHYTSRFIQNGLQLVPPLNACSRTALRSGIRQTFRQSAPGCSHNQLSQAALSVGDAAFLSLPLIRVPFHAFSKFVLHLSTGTFEKQVLF